MLFRSLRKALLFPQGHIVAQENAPDGKAILPQQPDQRRQQDVLKDRAGSYIITGTTKEGGLHHGE